MGNSKRRKKSAQRRGMDRNRAKPERRSSVAARQRQPASEELGVESLTVMWMLTAVATLAAQLVALAAQILPFLFGPADAPAVARIMPNWFLFCAAVTGMVCLAITPIVYMVRRRPPPTPITLATVVICLIPWLVLASKIGR